jgi:hypothetical protein
VLSGLQRGERDHQLGEIAQGALSSPPTASRNGAADGLEQRIHQAWRSWREITAESALEGRERLGKATDFSTTPGKAGHRAKSHASVLSAVRQSRASRSKTVRMTFRSTLAAVLATAVSLACSPPTEPSDAPTIPLTPAPAAAVGDGLASVGTSVTVSDVGWQRSFGGSINVEADATVIYAVAFGGSGGNAPVSGIAVGSQPLTLAKTVPGPSGISLDVYRLVSPQTGTGQPIQVTRSGVGYDPVRVTVFTVRGASTTDPNGPMTSADITPATASVVRSVVISSSQGALTLSAVVASPRFVDGTGVSAVPGYQSVVAAGEDPDGVFGVIGSAPGAGSVTHAWSLRADAGGRHAFVVSFSVNAGAATPPAEPSIPPPTGSAATFGTVATFSDVGWVPAFGGTMQVEADATVMYAVVFNGAAGNAPITGVALGGRAFTRVKSAERTLNASLDVFRLVSPATGPQAIAVQRTRSGYDPVRVSVFTVRGANTTAPNEAITEVDLTPGTATATRSVSVASSSDGLTISAVAASGRYVAGVGVAATQGFQLVRAGGQDADGLWGVLGTSPGAASVTHSWNLVADDAGRSAYLVSFTVNGATGSPPPAPAPAPPPPLPPPSSVGWTTVFDYDVMQLPAPYPGNYRAWVAHERPWEQMLLSNLSLVQDPTQPGTGNAGAARLLFLPSLPGGYAPINFWWGGAWPANNGSVDVTFTIKLSANWDNNGPQNRNDGIKLLFFATQPQNNHFISIGSRRYDGAEAGGTGTLGGAWVTVGLQNPTVSYKTSADLTRDAWHTIRVQVVANTPGTANGQLRVWVDGTQVLINSGRNDPPSAVERTDVMFFATGQTGRQDRIEFEPTYGGGYESPPYNQWIDIGHVTAAVR